MNEPTQTGSAVQKGRCFNRVLLCLGNYNRKTPTELLLNHRDEFCLATEAMKSKFKGCFKLVDDPWFLDSTLYLLVVSSHNGKGQ